MIVPNYVPDPIEVPGNVTEAPYRQRLVFIRRVAVLHLASVAWIGGVVAAKPPPVPLKTAAAMYLSVLLLLSLIRIGLRGTSLEAKLSASGLPILLTIAGLAAATLLRSGVPVWAGGLACSCAVVYTMLCGRDFSFVGQFFLGLIVSSLVVAGSAILLGIDHRHAGLALAIDAAVLFYYSYDLASLLSRRRIGEELAGVVDLYRDVLNVFGWLVRVIQHWFRHGIFTVPLVEPRKPAS